MPTPTVQSIAARAAELTEERSAAIAATVSACLAAMRAGMYPQFSIFVSRAEHTEASALIAGIIGHGPDRQRRDELTVDGWGINIDLHASDTVSPAPILAVLDEIAEGR
jgi:hypothetical protein